MPGDDLMYPSAWTQPSAGRFVRQARRGQLLRRRQLSLRAGGCRAGQRIEVGDDSVAREVSLGQVLRAQEVLDVLQVDEAAVADDLIGHPARLGTFAPVGRAAAERLTRQALTRIRHAERAVDKHLDGELGHRRR